MESNPITCPKEHGSEKLERPVLKQKQDISGSGYDKVDKFTSQDSGKKPMPHSHGTTESLIKRLFSMVTEDLKKKPVKGGVVSLGWQQGGSFIILHLPEEAKRRAVSELRKNSRWERARWQESCGLSVGVGRHTQPAANQQGGSTGNSICPLLSHQSPHWLNPAAHQQVGSQWGSPHRSPSPRRRTGWRGWRGEDRWKTPSTVGKAILSET